jgi:flagellar hook-associated protein 1 FlgK
MSLFSSLSASADALRVYERGLEVTQNNVNNASRNGYARQRLSIESLPFQPADGLPGGIRAGDIQSARNLYADQEVRRQLEALGRFQQKAEMLHALENGFDITGQGGVAGALNGLFQSFSAWSVSPNSLTARQAVLDAARGVSQAFQSASAHLATSADNADRELARTVNEINALGDALRGYNAERLKLAAPDPALEANITSALEQLSELVNFNVLHQEDGTITVLLGGQTPLVIGERQHEIRLDYGLPGSPAPVNPAARGHARILDSGGNDVTAGLQLGKLGGLLEVRNQILPSLMGDPYQAGDLNRLAKATADRVNQLLTSGQISDGPPPVAGLALFTYDAANSTASARTLAVNPALTAAQLAAIDPGPPYIGNGVALKLAALASPTDPAGKIDGLSYVEFFGEMAALAGREAAAADNGLSLQRDRSAQARALRDQLSGVSLDEEAIHLVEFQRAYQATARMISVLDELTQVAVNLLR